MSYQRWAPWRLVLKRLLPILQILYSSASSLRGYASLLDIISLLDQSPQTHIIEKNTQLMKFSQKISVENLTFRYSSSSPKVLDDVSFSIQKAPLLEL